MITSKLGLPFRLYLRACALLAGVDPDSLSVPDAVLLASMQVKTGQVPTFDEYYNMDQSGSRPTRPRKFELQRIGKQVRTTSAETADDIRVMMKMGWGRRAK